MAKQHILHDYSKLTDGQLGDFGLHVATLLTGNASFPTPPVTSAALTTAANNFIASVAASVNGTPANTAAKNALRVSLLAQLDQLANYVELVGNNDPVKMLSSGFNLANTGGSPAMVTGTAILSVTNVASGKLGLELQVDKNGWCYVIQTGTTPGVWTTALVVTNPHDAVLSGLTPGMTYAIRACVMGSGNQQSEWCDTVSHMST